MLPGLTASKWALLQKVINLSVICLWEVQFHHVSFIQSRPLVRLCSFTSNIWCTVRTFVVSIYGSEPVCFCAQLSLWLNTPELSVISLQSNSFVFFSPCTDSKTSVKAWIFCSGLQICASPGANSHLIASLNWPYLSCVASSNCLVFFLNSQCLSAYR